MTEHEDLVRRLVKSPDAIIKTLTPIGMSCLHMGVGIIGEAGETLEHLKKSVIHGKPIDIDAIINELGDIEFYMEGLRQELGITREQCLDANIAKLSKRYSSGKYSDKESAERTDTK